MKTIDGKPPGLILLEPTLTQKPFNVVLNVQKRKSKLQITRKNKEIEVTCMVIGKTEP